MDIEKGITGFSENELPPPTIEEEKLWGEIEGADKPIQTVLKRINRVLRNKFPGSGIQTVDSCSGHIQEDGSVAYKACLSELVDKKREMPPFLALQVPSEKFSTALSQEIEKFLDNLVSPAVSSTNDGLGKESLLWRKGEPELTTQYTPDGKQEEVYIFTSGATLLEKKEAFKVLQLFWKNMSDTLRMYDGLRVEETYSKEAYYPSKPGPGLVRPK